MISKSYRQNKNQVLSLYDEYVDWCNKNDINVDKSLSEQTEKIKNEIFNLMILGEAKSGKSTFINAYLGADIVPMDVRQCTSAIIKIKRGEECKLEAKTAAGGTSIVKGEDDVRAFLKEHAAISDEYRAIPITTINNEILLKFKDSHVPSKVIDSFIDAEKKDNIFNLDGMEYDRLIRKYISENAQSWGKIITEMEITFPLSEAMQGITIIDSPGVGAGGNVGQIAENYISNANAIIFVKSLSGQSLESSSFMNFLRNNCTNREKDFLFLVFTGKATLQGHDFERLKEQAIEMYSNDIQREKILFVDSKMQLFLNKCNELGTEEKIDEYFDTLDEENNDFAPASKIWLKARGDIKKFQMRMSEASNFNQVQEVLERFARAANYLQLIGFINNLEREYKRYEAIFSDQITTTEENINDPELLEMKIRRKRAEIADVFNKMNEGIDEIFKKYTDNINGEGIIFQKSNEMKKEYEKKLEHFQQLSENEINDQTFSQLKTMSMDAVNESKDFREKVAKDFLEECNKKLIKYTNDPSKIPSEAYAPNFTGADFDRINEYAQDKTSGYDLIPKGKTFMKTEERVPYHHLRDHIELVTNSISNRLDSDIFPKMVDNVLNYVSSCRNVYMEKLKEQKNKLDSEYKKLNEDKDDNEKLIGKVNALKSGLSFAKDSLQTIYIQKGELQNYVG